MVHVDLEAKVVYSCEQHYKQFLPWDKILCIVVTKESLKLYFNKNTR